MFHLKPIITILCLLLSVGLEAQTAPALQLHLNLWQQNPGGDIPLDSALLVVSDTLGNELRPSQTHGNTINLELHYDTVYWIRCSMEGLVAKTIEVDTRNAADSLRSIEVQQMTLELRLFAVSPGVNEGFIPFPIGFIAFQVLSESGRAPGFYPEVLRSQNQMYAVEYKILEANKRLKKEARKRKKEAQEEKAPKEDQSPE